MNGIHIRHFCKGFSATILNKITHHTISFFAVHNKTAILLCKTAVFRNELPAFSLAGHQNTRQTVKKAGLWIFGFTMRKIDGNMTSESLHDANNIMSSKLVIYDTGRSMHGPESKSVNGRVVFNAGAIDRCH